MTKLQKLQILACLGITGVPKACLTAAVERLVNLSTLHIIVQKEALHVTERICECDMLGDMGVLGEIPETSMVWAPTDIMIEKRRYNLPFEVDIPTDVSK